MDPDPSPADFEDLAAESLRELRDRKGWTQDDLARHLRESGLPWTRSMVAGVENLARRISLGELIAVLGAYQEPLPSFLASLVDHGSETVVLGGALMTRDALRELLTSSGPLEGIKPRSRKGEPPARQDVVGVLNGLRSAGAWREIVRALSDPGEDSTAFPELEGVLDYLRTTIGELEDYVARRLGSTSLAVNFLAHLLWGHSATEHREALALEGSKHRASREIVDEIHRALQGRLADIDDTGLGAFDTKATGTSAPPQTEGFDPAISVQTRRLAMPFVPQASRRYRPLSDWLEAQPARQASLSFADVERILDRELPPSARHHRAWWANDPTHSHARAWLAVGWEVRTADVIDETVRLERVSARP